MTHRLTADQTFYFAHLRKQLASPLTVRWSSAVDSTIDDWPGEWRAQASPTPHHRQATRPGPPDPEQPAARPSLASLRARESSVGGGRAWPLVPRSRTLEQPTLGSVRSFSTICNANVRTIHATRRAGRAARSGLPFVTRGEQ